jgi:heme-degrading monooxygenase HmoA
MAFIRISTQHIESGKDESVLQFVDNATSAINAASGLQRVAAGRTSDGHWVVVSFWDTREQAEAGFAAPVPDIATKSAAVGLSALTSTVFEIDRDITPRVGAPSV